jgi:histidine triad (HIT) family protein
MEDSYQNQDAKFKLHPLVHSVSIIHHSELLAMAETIFSKIISREIPADIVYEDDRVLAFRDIAPQAPTHILIVPKQEIATVNDIEEAQDNLVGYMVRTAADIARKEGIDTDGYRLVMNCNVDGGQAVYHLHLHLLGGRKMTWPPG